MSLFKDAKIKMSEEEWAFLTRDAFTRARNAYLVSKRERKQIGGPAAGQSAISKNARIRWYRALCKELERRFSYDCERQSVDRAFYFVTLTHTDFAVGHEKVGKDITTMGRRFAEMLSGFDFIGVIEPGLYSYIYLPTSNGTQQRCISWHVHGLVWNTSKEKIKERIRRLNRTKMCVPLMKGQTGADQRRVRDFPPIVGYICKPPLRVYRIGMIKRRHDQPCVPHARQYTSKRLRPGERVTLFRHLQSYRIDQLMISGGEGQKVFKHVRRKAFG